MILINDEFSQRLFPISPLTPDETNAIMDAINNSDCSQRIEITPELIIRLDPYLQE